MGYTWVYRYTPNDNFNDFDGNMLINHWILRYPVSNQTPNDITIPSHSRSRAIKGRNPEALLAALVEGRAGFVHGGFTFNTYGSFARIW